MNSPTYTPDPSHETLEWPRFLSLAQKEARTETAKSKILSLEFSENWSQDLATAKILQTELQDVLPLLEKEALWGPLSELSDPSMMLERLGRGSVLEIPEMALLRRCLYAIESWVQIPRDDIRSERFRKAMSQLADPSIPLRILNKLLTQAGELSENASPKLSAIYAEIRTLKREIGVVLDHLMKTFQQKGILQENFTDVRDGRYVLPIKISSQNEVEGIIYEASASRQTVFVEPREIALLNNRLRQRQNDLVQEIFNVLEAASKDLLPFTAEIALEMSILTYWDAVQAKARFGRHFQGKPIEVTSDRTFHMKNTAHPLLGFSMDPAQIIKNDIDFGEPVRTLLLTGPNTGGKTVLLKTLGLAGLCARTGFPFPGSDRATVPFFDSFFADLGDPQSIERHLSSFSGHVLRLKDILERVTANSLVLVDELNTATDPEEGAALARAFLEAVMEKGALVVATTHDPRLKATASSDSRIQNASMAFDEKSSSPTYRMLIGVSGRSRAIEIAERLGLPRGLIAQARAYLSKSHVEFEALLSRLESDAQALAHAKKEAVMLKLEAEKMKKEWTERAQVSVGELLEKTRQKLRRVMEQAQDEIRASVQKLDEMKSRKQLDETRGKINEAFGSTIKNIEKALEEEAPDLVQKLNLGKKSEEAPAPDSIQIGATVRIPKWKTTGVVVETGGGKLKVTMGTVQITLSSNDVEMIAPPKERTADSVKTSVSDSGGPSPEAELDLRGQRLEEAMSTLEAFLDLSFRSTARVEVTVIHGLGTGAIREGTRSILKNLPYIKSFRDGGVGRGGAGATIVEFERD